MSDNLSGTALHNRIYIFLKAASVVNMFIDQLIGKSETYRLPGQHIVFSQAISGPEDDDEDIDGCDIEVGEGDKTNDEDLPITQGGVA